MQYLLIFHIIFCVFINVASLVFCGIESSLLVSEIVMPSSNNIVASLCCYNVDLFITKVTILRYDCKLVLHTIVKKLFVVGTCKP